MVPYWCHGPDTLRRQPPPRPRRRRRGRRRGRACARRAARGSARLGGPADAARGPVRSRRRDHARARPRLRRAAAARPASPSSSSTPAPADEPRRGPPRRSPEGDEGATTRINLRLPEQLKASVEQAAGRERLSVNTWLVRAVGRRRRRRTAAPPQRGGAHRRAATRGWVPLNIGEPHAQLSTPPNRSPRPSTSSSATSASAPASATRTVVDVRPSDASNKDDVARRRADPRRARGRPPARQDARSCARGRSAAAAGRST